MLVSVGGSNCPNASPAQGWFGRFSAYPVLFFWAVQKGIRVEKLVYYVVSVSSTTPLPWGKGKHAHCMFPCFSSDSSTCSPPMNPALALPFWEHWSLARTGGHSWCAWISEGLASWVCCRLMFESVSEDVPEMFLITDLATVCLTLIHFKGSCNCSPQVILQKSLSSLDISCCARLCVCAARPVPVRHHCT